MKKDIKLANLFKGGLIKEKPAPRPKNRIKKNKPVIPPGFRPYPRFSKKSNNKA